MLEETRPCFCEEQDDPSSACKLGSKLKSVIEMARAQVAELFDALPPEVILTSCAR